ncbi:MAG: MFS transporter [Gammaproteobacteria bacterium]|nr:MFS transporter [Gammaproteobacteria bacterium]
MLPLTPHHRFLLGSLSLGHMVNDWVAGTIWLLAPAIAASMGLGPTEVGLILTINGLGAALAYIPAGIFADRSTHPGYLMLLSFWWVAIGYFSATLVSGFWAITLLLAFGVMGDAFWHPVATGVLVKEMPKRRAQVLGIHAVGGGIGADVLGPLATGFLLGFFDWQTSLQILVIPAFLMGILFIPIATRIGATAGNKISAIDLNGLVRHWLTGPGKLLILVMVLYNLSLIAILSMTPLYLQSEHGLTPFNAGLIFATMLLIGTIFQPFAGKYTDRRGRKPLIVITLIMSSLFATLAGLGSGLGWVVTGLLPAAALLTSIRPVVLAAAVDYSGKSEATTLGIVFTVLDGVGMLGALFAGLIGEFSLNYAFLLAAGFAMASALICMLLSFDFGTPSSFRPPSRNPS